MLGHNHLVFPPAAGPYRDRQSARSSAVKAEAKSTMLSCKEQNIRLLCLYCSRTLQKSPQRVRGR